MKKFKVGDKVRTLQGPERTVIDGEKNCFGDKRSEAGFSSHAVLLDDLLWYEQNDLTLAESERNSTESELQRLVRVANDALASIRSLPSLEGIEIKYDGKSDSWRALDIKFDLCFSLRKNQPPAFESFSLPDSGHKVFLDGGMLRVGCVSFVPESLQAALVSFQHGAGGERCGLLPTRNGLRHANGEMTWADADLLLSKLEKLSSGGRK